MATDISDWRTEIGYYAPGVDDTECDLAVLKAAIDFCKYTNLWTERLYPIDVIVVEATEYIDEFTDTAPATITSSDTTELDFTDYFSAGEIIVTNHQSAEDDEKDNTGPFVIAAAGVAAATITLATGEVVVADDDVSSLYIAKAVYPLTSSNGDIVEVKHAKLDGKPLIPKGEDWLDANVEGWRVNMGTPKYFTIDKDKYLRMVPVPNENMEHALEVWVSLKPSRTATTVEDVLYDDWMEAITFGALARLLSQTSKPWRDFEASEGYRTQYFFEREAGRRRTIYGHSRARSSMTA